MAQTFNGTNPSGGASQYSFQVGSGATNMSVTVAGDGAAYSYLLLRKGSNPTDTSYDYSSQDAGRGNAVCLEQPELSAGTWYARVKTPTTSATHTFSVVVQTNRSDLRTSTTPVSKTFSADFSSTIQGGINHFYRVELTTNAMWRVSLESTNANGPDLYINRGQPPTASSFLKKAFGGLNDSIAFNAVEGVAGVYYIGVFGGSAPAAGVGYTLQIAPVTVVNLAWDPGTAHLGTAAYINNSGVAGDYYFKVTTANPAEGAWRIALRMQSTNDANLYLSKGALPTPSLADLKSERLGADGLILGLGSAPNQFLPSQDWYILVRAKANAPFALVSGSPYVTDLGTVAANGSSGSGDVEVGAEGIRYFSTSVTADMLAWRLYLNGASNPILVSRTSVPLPNATVPNANPPGQAGQLLVVPPVLTVGQYYIGVPGVPGSVVKLDSRPQAIQEIPFESTTFCDFTGYGYSTFKIVVPTNQIAGAWQLYLPSTNGNPNFALRRLNVPNEAYNDAYSELIGTNLVDNITLVPTNLTGGTYYLTVYSTNAAMTNTHSFTLQSGPAVMTDIDFNSTITNDDPERVGWRYYRVTDISQQTNSPCWTLSLSNSTPGTRIAIRRTMAPSRWYFRNLPTYGTFAEFLRESTATFLQDPNHQSDVYYIGVYNPSNQLGAFTLTTQSTQPEHLADNSAVTRTNVEGGRWEFFSVELTDADIRQDNPAGQILGLDVRLANVTGMPRIYMRREWLPTLSPVPPAAQATYMYWTTGEQLAADKDWTDRSYSDDGTIFEEGRSLAVGVGRPLLPGKYYVGVVSTNEASYQILARWIGPNRSIPVIPLAFMNGAVTNTVPAREAAYYQVVIPTNQPSWKVSLTPLSGEVMLVAATNRVPSMKMDKKVKKPGKEHFVMLPPGPYESLTPGTNYLVVAGEGQSPSADNRIGLGASQFVLKSHGNMSELDLGYLVSSEQSVSGSLEAGESVAYHFHTFPSTLGFYLKLEDRNGNPVMVSRPGMSLADPGVGSAGIPSDPYGNDGGKASDTAVSNYRIIWDGATHHHTVMLKARASSTNNYDASYTLKIVQIYPTELPFDGMVNLQTDGSEYGSFWKVQVPEGAMGWDLRLTNVLSGNPQLVVRREALPVALTTGGFVPVPTSAHTSRWWPEGAQWAPGVDWTGRSFSPTGTPETGRILALGMEQPLNPGLYTIGVIGNSGEPVSATLVSRGIGSPYSVPIRDLSFSNGTQVVTGLPAREAAYFRVLVPTNTPSWKLRVSNTSGENMLAVMYYSLPNIGAGSASTFIDTAGRRMNRVGDEQFLMLPPAGQNSLAPGYYYLALVSEGQADPNFTTRVGPGVSSFSVTSYGVAPVINLGAVGATDIVRAGFLAGGESQIYEFTVPEGMESMELRLQDRTGNPVMLLRRGAQTPYPGSYYSGAAEDKYGVEGGETAMWGGAELISAANLTNGIYRLVVKARNASTSTPLVFPDAAYTLRITATGTVPLEFDQGVATIEDQTPNTWRYFRVVVPTNAAGWDLRLTDVRSGLPRITVRRDKLPETGVVNTPGWMPGSAYAWPTLNQWAPYSDWTKRTYSVDGSTLEDGRVLAMGMNRPLEPGVYFVSVRNTFASTNMSYTLRSRGIGQPYSVPIRDLPFMGSITNLGLAARDAAYYRIVIPSNAPSWKLKLSNLAGESMMAVLRNALPNIESTTAAGDTAGGKTLQKAGNEHLVVLPKNGSTNIQSATNFLAVISEGRNPFGTQRIGSGTSDYIISSLGPLAAEDLGLLSSEDITRPETLEDGEVKGYQFEVPYGTLGFRVELENRSGNPVAVLMAGDQFPDPGASVVGQAQDFYGNEGGYAAGNYGIPPFLFLHSNIVTVANPAPGMYRLAIKARSLGTSSQNAAFNLRIREILVPQLNFAAELNTNGLSNEATNLLQNHERAFYKFIIPADVNGAPILGWKLDLLASSGSPSMRVCQDVLPADRDESSLMPFTTGTAVIAPPFLTNGVWYVEVRGSGSSAFTLRSSALELERPAWSMPAPGATNRAPGVALPDFADSSVDTNGVALPGGILLDQGASHYYAIKVPETNSALLQVTLEALDGNPDLYLREGSVPTLSHRINGGIGAVLYDRSMTSTTNTEYANWVPFDGKTNNMLKPGLWFLAVKANGNTYAKYRFTASLGDITDLPIHGPAVVNQEVKPGNWKYYRVQMPSALPLTFSVSFSQQSGDVLMYLRDTVPPGNGITTLPVNIVDWGKDLKSFGPYNFYDPPGTYTFSTPPVRPGEPFYIGFRAPLQATFNLQITTNGAPVQEPIVVPFYGGSASTVLAPLGTATFRVDVPEDAIRWKHVAAHESSVTTMIDQGTVPTRTQNRWLSYTANSSYSKELGKWDNVAKQYVPVWPWVAGHAYFMFVTNNSPTPQEFTLNMDGRNTATDDEDNDGLPDAWEYFYFSSTTSYRGDQDSDNDTKTNLEEFREGTNPMDAQSYLARLLTSAARGTIQRNPDLANYQLGSKVTLTPVPAPGYAFIGWSGSVTSSANPLILTMDAHKSLFATFKLAGDDFITALPISGAAASLTATNLSFTKETGEPFHAGNPGGKSIWWRWAAPTSGRFTLSTTGTPFNTLLAVYTGGSVGGLTRITSDSTYLGGVNGSSVTFEAAGGTVYSIAVDGYNGASGRIQLSLAAVDVAPITVLGPPSFLPGGMVMFSLSGEANHSYQIQFSTNLRDWMDLGVIDVPETGNTMVLDPSAPGITVRFYRAQRQ